jgi:hypothetical protein
MDILAEQSKSNQNYHVGSIIRELLDLESDLVKRRNGSIPQVPMVKEPMTVKQ